MAEHGARHYAVPRLRDFGTVIDMTRATGITGTEDGVGKTVQAEVGPVDVSVGILP